MLRISKGFVAKLCVFYLLLWSVCPPLSLDMIYRFGALACAGLWMLAALRRDWHLDAKAFLFLLLTIFVALIETLSVSGVLRQIAIYMLCIASFMYSYYKDKMEQLEGITFLILALFVVWNLRTFVELNINPNVARSIVRNDESMYPYIRQGVGGYALVYSQVCMFPVALCWVFQAFKGNKFCFVVGTVWLCSFGLLLLKSGYSIALAACATSLVILYFYRGRSAVQAIVVALAVVASIVLLLLYSEGFRSLALSIFEGTKVEQKIHDLVSTSETDVYATSISARMTRYMASLRMLVQYPAIGSLWFRSGAGHSAILDTLAKYGWFGGYVYLTCLLQPLRWIRNQNGDLRTQRMVNAAVTSIVIVGLLNSMTYEFMFVLVLFIPMLYQDIRKWREKV